MVVRRVDNRKFTFLGLGEDGVRFGESSARGGGDELGGHDDCDGVGEVRMELNIAGRYHADEGRAERAVFCPKSASGTFLGGCSWSHFWRFLIGLKIVSPQYDDIVLDERKLFVFVCNHRKASDE